MSNCWSIDCWYGWGDCPTPPPKAGAYWGCTLQPWLPLSGYVSTPHPLMNPKVTIHDCRVDGTEDTAIATEKWWAVKVPANTWNERAPNSFTFDTTDEPWKVELADPYHLAVYTAVFDGVPNYDLVQSTFIQYHSFDGSIGVFVDGEQYAINYLHGYVTYASGEEAGYFRISQFKVNDASLILESGVSTFFGFYFYYDFGVPRNDPIEEYAGCLNFPRRNFSIGLHQLVATSYDCHWVGTLEWGVCRQKIGTLGPGFTTAVVQAPDSSKHCVCLPSFHSWLDSVEDTNEPWVIAFKADTGEWVEAVWTSEEKPGGPDDENGVLWLSDDDVTAGNVLSTGVMSERARVLCYNRVRGRTLAIFLDQRPPVFDAITCNYLFSEDPEIIWYGYRNEWTCYLYDSDLPEGDQLVVYDERIYCSYPDDDNTTVYPCRENPDAMEQGFNEPAGTYMYSEIELDYGYVPAFITCDESNQVYVGSPRFVSKLGRYAVPASTVPQWEYIAREFYPEVPCTFLDCSSGEVVDGFKPLPYTYLATSVPDGRVHNFGSVDPRDFQILPTRQGIQVRGLEGVIEMSSPLIEFADNATQVLPIQSAEAPWLWINAWTFSPDGLTRVPHIEAKAAQADYLFDNADMNAVQVNTVFRDNDDAVFPTGETTPFFVFDTDGVYNSETWYWSIPTESIFNDQWLASPKTPYLQQLYSRFAAGWHPRDDISLDFAAIHGVYGYPPIGITTGPGVGENANWMVFNPGGLHGDSYDEFGDLIDQNSKNMQNMTTPVGVFLRTGGAVPYWTTGFDMTYYAARTTVGITGDDFYNAFTCTSSYVEAVYDFDE